MTISEKLLMRFRYRLIASILIGKWITKRRWKLAVWKQFYKGLTYYNKTLDECPNDGYNWTDEALEEFVDGFSYVLKSKLK